MRSNPAPLILSQLDVAIVAVEPRSPDGKPLDEFGWLRLNPAPGKAFVGEYLTIIQHPGGARKQICVRENKLLKYDDNSSFIWYQTDTVGGSSGSPVFNNSWDVVALHHSGVPRVARRGGKDVWLTKQGLVWTPDMGDDAVDWIANEGVRISRIVGWLEQQFPTHPISRAIRTAPESPGLESLWGTDLERGGGGGVRIHSDSHGNTRVSLPLEIGIQLDVAGLRTSLAQTPPVPAPDVADAPASRSRVSVAPWPVEKVDINQDNYHERNGYDPRFLGDGLVAPLPRLAPAIASKALKFGGKSELKYWNYSVVMRSDRNLAFFSAANVDPGQAKGERDKDGDRWYKDSRIPQDRQTGQEFYKSQKTFEADRSENPFDQGHLTSRNNLQWGASTSLAKRHGDDSFHYTNCAPQHWQFNQNNKRNGLWFRLEISAVELFSKGERLCVINGPIFDAPRCTHSSGGKLVLNLKGKAAPDLTFGGVRIPKQFFKVIVYNESGELRAKAFIVTQEDLLDTVGRLHRDEAAVLTDAEIRLYQVKLRDLERLTGLKFGLPAAAEHFEPLELARIQSGLPLASRDELFRY